MGSTCPEQGVSFAGRRGQDDPEYTAIEQHPQESRKEWMLWMFSRAGSKSSNVKGRQFWQHHNKPVELWSPHVIEQKADYTHFNPVAAGLVNEPWHWKYSSAIDYCGGKGLLEIDLL